MADEKGPKLKLEAARAEIEKVSGFYLGLGEFCKVQLTAKKLIAVFTVGALSLHPTSLCRLFQYAPRILVMPLMLAIVCGKSLLPRTQEGQQCKFPPRGFNFSGPCSLTIQRTNEHNLKRQWR